MFEELETTYEHSTAVAALEQLLFDDRVPIESLVTSCELAASNGLSIHDVIDSAAERRLETLGRRPDERWASFPDDFVAWVGSNREGTEAVYDIARQPTADRPPAVRAYQTELRQRLPDRIPLVRGVDGPANRTPSDGVLQPWTARVGHALLHGDTICYTVVTPEQVFMAARYGNPDLGEDEFTLDDWSVVDTHPASIETHLRLYRRMDDVLNR
jgi:hypothetical protein